MLDLRVLKRIPKGKINLDLSQEMGGIWLNVTIAKKKGHFKRNYPKRKKDFKEKNVSDGGASICEFGYDIFDALAVCENSVK